MNEALKKLSLEIRDEIAKAIASVETQELIAKTKGADVADTGTFEVIISTSDVDRAGDSVDQNGWDLSFYKANPVVLWAHDYKQMPIGVCDSLEFIPSATKAGAKDLLAKGRFAPTEMGQQARQLYDLKMLRATSVGFIAKETEGHNIIASELLEFSFVPVPANPYALSIAKANNIEAEALMVKGFLVKDGGEVEDSIKCPECGAKCQTEDKYCAKCGAELKKDEEVEDSEKKTEVEEKVEEVKEETPVEEKGLVSDELEFDRDDYWKKWDMVEDVMEIINTFFDVYFRNSVKSDQLPALLTEMIGLLQQVADGTYQDEDDETDDGVMEMAMTGEKTTEIGKAYAQIKSFFKTKEGRSISGANATKLSEILDQFKTATGALETFCTEAQGAGSNTETEDEGGDDSTEGAKAQDEENSNKETVDSIAKSLDSYLASRAILRKIATVVGSSLEDTNKRIREASGLKN